MSAGFGVEAALAGRGYGWWCELPGRELLDEGPARLPVELENGFGVESDLG